MSDIEKDRREIRRLDAEARQRPETQLGPIRALEPFEPFREVTGEQYEGLLMSVERKRLVQRLQDAGEDPM